MIAETKKLTKTQKAKANQLQKDLFQPIVKHNIDIQKHGEPCVNARTLLQMWDSGLFADNPDEFIFLLKLNLIAEHFRELSISQKSNISVNLECDTSRLYIGLVAKNYKEMCLLLNEDTKTGKAKIKQIENWKRFFDFEKLSNSNEYIILDIYPEPFPKGTKRNTQFTNQLAVLILRELIKQKENDEGNIIYYTTYRKLIKKLNVVNQFFYKESLKFFISKYPEWFKSDSDFEDFKRDCNIFKTLTKRKIKGAVQSALVNLKKDNLTYYAEYHRIKENDSYRNATTNEEIYIQSVKKEISESMGYRNSNVATLYDAEKFNELFKERLQVEKGWDYVFYQLEIDTKKDMLLKHISEYTSYPIVKSIYGLSGSKENSIRLEYNSNLSNALIEQTENMADTKIKNKMKKFRESNTEYDDMTDEEIVQIYGLDKEILNKYNNQYIERQKSLINYLISFNKDRIQELMDFYSNQICNAEQEFIEEM
ncbi:MAG: hypothetical protein HDT39_09225 [Lachnospiraceae bacterium]|nr:hypothetical protein [Lachnospiraceae bacterium]